MSLEIILLPEFGWSINDKHVFGPGSVFQGFIKLNLSQDLVEKAGKVRIVFHGNESIYTLSRSKPLYNKQLFGSQRIIWKKKVENEFTAAEEITRSFTIQLPMVNFPPSSNIVSEVEGISYHSNYQLTAYLDQADGTNLLKAQQPILYMPLIEINALKNPLVLNMSSKSKSSADEEKKSLLPLTVKLQSLDYVPGDSITAHLEGHNNSKRNIESFTLKLYHIQTWIMKDTKVTIQTKQLISSNTNNISNNMTTLSDRVENMLEIPQDAIPSFNYSAHFNGSYQLQINIKQKGMLWSHETEFATIPIHIGTLGFGIHSPEKIKDYSSFKSAFDGASDLPALPVPQFLNEPEYEECLPVYQEQTVPPYEIPSATVV